MTADERIAELAREVALRTGRTRTSAIEWSLERLLAELDRESDGRQKRLARAQILASDLALDARDFHDETGQPPS